jgi:hypothetical protein
MPPSTRGELFVSFSKEELDRLKTKLDCVNSLEGVHNVLGEPDIIKRACKDGDDSKDRPTVAVWFYNQCAETVKVVIQERFDGRIQIDYLRKEKR